MTLYEVLVVIVVLVIVIGMVLPAFTRPRRPRRISCINYLKQIGTAYRVWANDNGDKYPQNQFEAMGGMKGLVDQSSGEGGYTYMVYSLMQNELGQSPKIVQCPDDTRPANTNFYFGPKNAPPGTNFASVNVGTFDNTNVSYFVGAGADATMPQSILGGDRNLGLGIDSAYGISGTSAVPGGRSGADAIVNTNGTWVYAAISGGGGVVHRGQAVAWSARMHSADNPSGAGNILLGDGSAQQCTSAGLRLNWLRNAVDLGNFATNDHLHSTNRGDIRLLFP